MVEGAAEITEELHRQADEADTKAEEEAQPAALDEEVAAVISHEEVKDALPPTPPPARPISPTPVSPELALPVEDETALPVEDKTALPMDMDMDSPVVDQMAPTSPAKPALPVAVKTGSPADDERGDILTPPLPLSGLPDVDGTDHHASRKRGRSDEPTIPEPSKRPRKTYDTPLPPTLSHLSHNPTSTLYITNLRRPFLHAALHDLISPSDSPSDRLPTPKPPFAASDHPNLWLSGVKDHAYAAFASESAAIDAAERLEGRKWPEETGQELHVEFVPDEMVRNIVEREEFAWANGRQKVTLRISRPTENEEWSFDLVGNVTTGNRSGSIGSRPGFSAPNLTGRPPPMMPIAGPSRLVPPPRSNLNGDALTRPPVGAPTGPAAGVGIKGRAGYAVPPHLAKTGNGEVSRGPGGGGVGVRTGPGAGRLGNPMRRTRVRPGLFWKEGPGRAV